MSSAPVTPATDGGGGRDVVVVLSSYNGSRFISEQIESIRRQSFAAWTLLVRDDGSTDDTVRVVEGLASADPRIVMLRDGRGNLGPAASFGALLERAAGVGARYVALADQDDVWDPEKLAHQLEILGQRETAVGASTPLLVHSDLAVVAEDLRVVHPSFMTFQGLEHVAENPLGRLLIQNFVTGCTAVVNGALLQAALPFPKVIMHDWWLAQCAAAMGEVLYLPEPTVLYRQHGGNTLGSRGWRQAAYETIRRPLAWWGLSGTLFSHAVGQARELAHRVERQSRALPAPCGSLPALREFTDAFGSRGRALQRLRVVRRYGFRPRSLLPYPVCFYARVLLWSTRLAGITKEERANPLSSQAGGRAARLPTLSAKD